MMSIDISNMEPFVGFSFDLSLPDVMTYLPNSEMLTNRKTDHVISATTLNDGKVRIVSYSPTNAVFIGNEGDIINLDFLIDGQGGFYSINFSDPIIGDINKDNIISDHYGGILEIAAPDIELSNTTINFGDVSIFETPIRTFIVNNNGSDTLKISNLTTDNIYFTTEIELPVNINPGQNTQIPVTFQCSTEGIHNATLRLRSNDPDEDPVNIQLSANVFTPNIMRVDSTSISWNDTGWVSVSIENNESFVGFQFDLNIPEGLSYSGDVSATGRLSDHVLNAQLTSQNVLTVFAFSSSQAEIDGNSGPVIDILFKAGSDHDSYPITLNEVIIGNSNSENIVSSWEGATLSVMQNMSIGLIPGWNLVSWNVDALNDSIETLFSDIMDDIEIVLGFVNAGLTYNPDLPQFSTLKQCDHLHGYWIKMKTSAQYSIQGLYKEKIMPIELNSGWNLVSYLPNISMDVEPALGSITDKVIVVLGFEEGGLTYDPDLPQFSTLNTLTPGFGYWIKVSEACVLIYPDNQKQEKLR